MDEQLQITDVSVRLPINVSTIERALLAVEGNNRLWNEGTGHIMMPQLEKQAAQINPERIKSGDRRMRGEVRTADIIRPQAGLTSSNAPIATGSILRTPLLEVSRKGSLHQGWPILPFMMLGVIAWIGVFWFIVSIIADG